MVRYFSIISVSLCITLLAAYVPFAAAQNARRSVRDAIEDSICKYSKRYDHPQRTKIDLPARQVSNAYKIRELHRALPEKYKDENSEYYYLYSYYFLDGIADYDENGDSTFHPKGDALLYKLKDTYVLDINGDGLPDILHHPKYYRVLHFDHDFYDIFIKRKNGTYKLLRFDGYIVKIVFDSKGILDTLKTFQDRCCDDNHTFFREYTLDRSKDELIRIKMDTVLTCQFRPKEKR